MQSKSGFAAFRDCFCVLRATMSRCTAARNDVTLWRLRHCFAQRGVTMSRGHDTIFIAGHTRICKKEGLRNRNAFVTLLLFFFTRGGV